MQHPTMIHEGTSMFKTISLLTAFILSSHALLPAADATLPQAVDQAHTELWRRFVDPHGIIRDFVGELPTPEDCTPG